MKYDTEQMTFIGAPGSQAENAALALHYEIMAAAQSAASSLLALARKIKQMRDTGGYKALGFETLEDYTYKTMGMKQRQAYNYIAIAEKLPAQLIEQNAAAGVTKLALLAQLSGNEQQQITERTDLTDTTVAELKAQIKELQAKNAGYAEQLSLLQDSAPVEDAQAEEVDMEALRESIRAEVEAKYRADLDAAEQDRRDRDAALIAAKRTRAELDEARKKAAERAANRTAELAEARQKGAEDAREEAKAAAEKEAQWKIERAEADRIRAEKRADELAEKMETAADESMVKFGLLFDQLQDTVDALLDLADDVKKSDDPAKAEKMRKALCKALRAAADNTESGVGV